MRRSGALRDVAGIVFRNRDGALERTPARGLIRDLDALPFPAWDLVDLEKYWKMASMTSMGTRPYFTIFTSRGCPFHCTYFHNIFGKKFRARSRIITSGERVDPPAIADPNNSRRNTPGSFVVSQIMAGNMPSRTPMRARPAYDNDVTDRDFLDCDHIRKTALGIE